MATLTILRPATTWVNADGLPVRFGKGNQVDAVVGSPVVYGSDQEFIADIVFDRLPAFQAAGTTGVFYGDYPNAAIPNGALIKSAVLTVTTAFAGSTAALTLGLINPDGTDITYNGLLTATDGAVANLTLGAAQAGTGGLIGTKITATNGAYLYASVTTASFTAGVGRLKITYLMPDTDKNNS